MKDYGDIPMAQSSKFCEVTNLPDPTSHVLRHGDHIHIRHTNEVGNATRRVGHTYHDVMKSTVRSRHTPQILFLISQISESTTRVLQSGRFCLTLGGDHSIAMGTVSGAAAVHRDLGVLWVDAHADLNTALTTASGNMHGMPLAFLMKEMRPYLSPLPPFEWLQSWLAERRVI